MNDIWKYIISLVIGFVIGILISVPSCQKQPESETIYIEKHDTVTITKDSIIYKTKIKEVHYTDTFYVKESGDTVKLDSIPITEKVYEDTIKTDSTSTEIKIEYSGFNAEINNIWLRHNYFNQKEIIVKEPKKIDFVWALGVGGGFGGDININNKTVGYGPQVGAYLIIGLGGPIRNGK